eukprot:gnl/MRDRNA2_/MRDRNA2_164430_c0_seq1.p1 gnl/MRDRNA2_/MRDRNA2_164430_c0~~gnl/MRDRNA2_/MRDRNA2_164430_c0_seq1.p1  ORF type:complete len:507 (-),score=125.59 gnl/MRDRNA2_/MRDRNA2_164430_c0_seq1:75-1595(-)
MASLAVQHAECPISLEPLCKSSVGVFLDATGRRTSAHFFSFAAAEEWQKKNGTCPMTRKSVASVKKLPELSQDPQAWFRVVDWDGDGKLSREEIIRAMQAQLNLDMQKVEHLIKDDGLWSRWDSDGSGFIEPGEIHSIQEFVRRPEFRGSEAGRIPDIVKDREAWFNYWDDDEGGTLDKEEVVRALVKTLRQTESTNYGLQDEMRGTLDLIWFLFDPDMDGEITKTEFLKADGLADTVIAQLSARPPPPPLPTPPSGSTSSTDVVERVPPVVPNAAQALAGYSANQSFEGAQASVGGAGYAERSVASPLAPASAPMPARRAGEIEHAEQELARRASELEQRASALDRAEAELMEQERGLRVQHSRDLAEADDRTAAQQSRSVPDQKNQQPKEVTEIVQALNSFRSSYKEPSQIQGLLTCLKTLKIYISNLAKNPQEEKFRKINRANNAFKSRIEPYPEAITFLKAVGFFEESENLVVPPTFARTKGPWLWDCLAKLDVTIDKVSKA